LAALCNGMHESLQQLCNLRLREDVFEVGKCSLLRAAVMTREGLGSGCLATTRLMTPFLKSLASLAWAAVQDCNDE